MAQAKRARSSPSGIKVSSGGKRARKAKDHYNSISNKRRFIVFLSCFAFVVLITGIAMAGSLKNLNELNDQKAALLEQKEDLEITSERLSQEVEYTNTKEFVEYMARKLLGWINPNDKKYIIVD
ncbi:MAG: septum formation initiator family protein [Eubacteriales bacterium]